MINNNIQLLSWFFSIIAGFVYSIFLFLFSIFIKSMSKLLKIFLSSIFVIIISTFMIYAYYKINNGFIHYSYLVFWLIGYYLFYLVKSNVKRQKK